MWEIWESLVLTAISVLRNVNKEERQESQRLVYTLTVATLKHCQIIVVTIARRRQP